MNRVLHALAGVATAAWQLGHADAATAEFLHAMFEQHVSDLRVALTALGWKLVRRARTTKDPKK